MDDASTKKIKNKPNSSGFGGTVLLSIDTTLSANEYRLVRVLRALANENRFIIFKNLREGPRYAALLNGSLKISRPALGKHVRILVGEGLVEQKHVVEGGTAKAIYELTNFGEKIAEKMNGFTDDFESITSQRNLKLREELMDVNTQIESTKAILKGLEKRVKNNEISSQDYSSLKSEYNKQIDILKKKEKELKQRLGIK